MSLKHFHIVFIALAVLLCAGFGAWTFLIEEVTTVIRVTGIVSLVLGVVLALYGIWFYRKSKRVII